MTRRSWRIAASLAVLALSLGALAHALAVSDRRAEGFAALGVLLLAILALGLALRAQEERLRRTRRDLVRTRLRAEACVEASPDGVVLLDGVRIVGANPAFRRLLAIPPDEPIEGLDLLSFVEPDDRPRVRQWLEQRLAGIPEPDHLEITAVRRTGMKVGLEAACARIPGDERRTQLVLFLRDTTGRRTVDVRSRQLERVEALVDIAETIVAEFESVLSRIQREARAGRTAGDGAAERFEAIDRAASRGLALVRRVRMFAPGSGDEQNRRPIDLVRLVRETAADFLRGLPAGFGLEVRTEGPKRIVVRADPVSLRQAIWQALQNARDAMDEGEIVVRTRVIDLDETRAASHPGAHRGPWAIVEVRDTGHGMTEEVRLRAFEPFFTTRGPRAAGLGLTSAYATARALGGYIELDSEPGRGTIFRLAIPLAEDAELPEEVTAEEPDPRARWRGRESILVVDDDAGARESIRELLERYGYHVEEAANPRDALERLRKRPGVDLVLLDMVLPGRSGLDVLRRIVRRWPGQRVIMLSPYPLPDQEAQALAIGAADTFRKPATDPDLPRAVREALDRPPPAPEDVDA
ncbi:MAG: PAS domain-containing sensor histidine kinase [Acidobacteriota bacterium]